MILFHWFTVNDSLGWVLIIGWEKEVLEILVKKSALWRYDDFHVSREECILYDRNALGFDVYHRVVFFQEWEEEYLVDQHVGNTLFLT